MGILASKQQKGVAPTVTKRRSAQLDFSNLTPLKPGGTVGFSSFRDTDPAAARPKKSKKKTNGNSAGGMDEDSDDEDDDEEIAEKMEDDDKEVKTALTTEDAKFQGELAEGVGRIKVSHGH
jgi:hypothetical protein